MGHVNVRYYVAMFDDASLQLLGRLSPPDEDRIARRGWADVRCMMEFKSETLAGTLLTIRSSVVRLGSSSLIYEHVMSESTEGVVHATAQITTVRFDLDARKAFRLESDIVEKAAKLLDRPMSG